MATSHLFLQGKGGVGKSLVAVLRAQDKLDRAQMLVCIDADPVNRTLARYERLNVKRPELLEDGVILTGRFDELIRLLSENREDVLVDHGARTFVPLSHYLVRQEVPSVLAQLGSDLMAHTVITGGATMGDTLSGFEEVAGQFAEPTRFIVWRNPSWGPIEDRGRSFREMKPSLLYGDRMASVIELPPLEADTFGVDCAKMLGSHGTFEEAIKDPEVFIITQQRLTIIRQALYALFDQVGAF